MRWPRRVDVNVVAAVSLDTLRELMQHMEWADACVWRAVLAHRAAVQDTRLRDLVLHLHGVQRAFLAVWTARPLEAAVSEATGDLLPAQAAVRSYYNDLSAAVASFDETMLRQPIVMPGLEPYEQRMGRRFDAPTLAETMLQVVCHSTYHRGQVNARLREVGGEPPLVDYIAWIWFGRPVPEWTARPSS
jgi:uncharacterized damage-inducible protein DinB